MFTGLIEEMGTITGVVPSGDGASITIAASLVLEDASHGDSISVSGVCLTVIEQGPGWFVADVIKETLEHSDAGNWAKGTPVNLERAARVGDRLGGHIVQGHVDATGDVLAMTAGDRWSVMRFSLADEIAPLVAKKGSITLDGVSLTISDVGRDFAEVSLIPETLSATSLGSKKPGDSLNIETDILARHVQRLGEFRNEAVHS